MYAYQGDYRGQSLSMLAESFEYYWAPQGYWCVDGRFSPIEPAFRELVGNAIPGTWGFTMLTKLEQGNYIPPHNDKPLAEGVTRYHLVLQSNEHSWCMHDNQWQQMAAGGVYTMNPQYVHAAINWGATPRVRLVVDTVDTHAS